MTKYNGIDIDYTRDSNLSEFGLTLLKEKYLKENETSPQEAFARAAVAYCGGDLALAQRIYNYASNQWVGFASPVLSNATYPDEPVKNLPISCYLSYVTDSVRGLLDHVVEIANLTVLGGGTGGHWVEVRSSSNKSPGSIPFIKSMDTIIDTYQQGQTRRGAYAAYKPISDPDIQEFLKIRIPTGDSSRKCHSVGFHNAVIITDEFMGAVHKDLDFSLIDPHSKEVKEIVKARVLWEELLTTRVRTGEPYILFIDTVNRYFPEAQKKQGLKCYASNLCIEIVLATNNERTAVCCLSSLNVEKYDEWKDTPIVQDMITFLDNVLQVFIDNAPETISKAKYSAEMERALGLGVMGYHAYLKKNNWAFGSDEAYKFNNVVFNLIQDRAIAQSLILGKEKGESPDMRGTGRRNSHLLALAPTANNAILVGTSPSIEPDNSNLFVHKTRVGSFLVKDKYLEIELDKIGLNTNIVWKKISEDKGSIQNIKEIPDNIKQVFKTAFEIDQIDIIRQAADRQQYICQSQSLNIFLNAGVTKAYVNKVHLLAHELGVKSLYYIRNNTTTITSISKETDRVSILPDSNESSCEACEG